MMNQLEINLRDMHRRFPEALYHISLAGEYRFDPATGEIVPRTEMAYSEWALWGKLTGSFENWLVGVLPAGSKAEIKVDYGWTLAFFRLKDSDD